MTRERIVACLSGGVDSSVAAALLVEAGHDVVGVFMRSGVAASSAEGEHKGCCSVEDALDARRVADRLGVPFYALNMEREFGRVVERFVDDYAAGRTPNPCVLCNRVLKLGHVMTFAAQVGATRVATGHYARVAKSGGRHALRRPTDRRKDQSYVLGLLDQEQLARLLLPLGDLTKPEVRALARARGLDRVADKPESQELCFVPDDYRDVLRARLPEGVPALAPGAIVDEAGRAVGRHDGTAGFTVGQRKGLGIAAPRPLYVLRTDPVRREVVVGPVDRLGARRLVARDVAWLGAAPGSTLRGRVQVRAHGQAAPATVRAVEGGFEVLFDAPARAVVPGQAAVVYDEADDVVLAGGWIDAVDPA